MKTSKKGSGELLETHLRDLMAGSMTILEVAPEMERPVYKSGPNRKRTILAGQITLQWPRRHEHRIERERERE
jgi:hypothetical protein